LSVHVLGREGTPEATKPIPLGTYGYGTATSNGQLQYTLSGQATDVFVQPYTKADTSPMGDVSGFSTFVILHDVSGDGLPDLVETQVMFPDWLHSTKSVSMNDGDTPAFFPPEVRGLKQGRYLSDSNVENL
jgi:hypothetical protein